MSFEGLKRQIIACRRCPRLVAFRENVPIRTIDLGHPWRKPLPGFGDEKGWLLILGLAPSANGGNRTGRVFTGDESGRFLMEALFDTGFANQTTSEHAEDGLKLKGCFITAAVKCVPPLNRPTREEFLNCSSYLENELFLFKRLRAVLALGKLAFDSYQNSLIQKGALQKRSPFAHGACITLPQQPTLYGSYHTTPQNTYTGKLTQSMFQTLLKQIQKAHSRE